LATSVGIFFAGVATAAQNQVITISAFGAKTYGDADFNLSATASSGLPITKWESTDPSVALISSSGVVTLVGAGQTSIIASSAGDASYNATWIARPLNVARSSAPLPSGTQAVTYNGSAQGLNANTLPSGQASEITYRDTAISEATATPQVVFQNGPDTLDLSYLSTGLQAVGYWGLAKYASLGGTARKVDSCDVTLISYARYDHSNLNYDYVSWADAHPDLVVPPAPGISIPGNSGGYYHPVTLAFYTYENDGVAEKYRLLTTQTVQALVPWRPAKGLNGVSNYSNFGYAFRVPFSFPDGVILPQQVWISVSFNTNTNGTAPVGAPGPYDALNIASPSGAQIAGTTLFPTTPLIYKDWRWLSSTGSSGPMLRLRAVPTNFTLAAPINAGTYEIKTKAAGFGTDGNSSSTLLINKALLQVTLSNLSQIRDGTPKPAIVTTSPLEIATSVSYSGSSTAPSSLGSYPVNAASNNPNYEGQASGTLQIGDNFGSWQTASFAGSGLPAEQTTDAADPDGDGLSNFLEYASNLNPLSGQQPSPSTFQPNGNTLDFIYRRNVNALDLDYIVQDCIQLPDISSWSPASLLSETTVSDDGFTRVIRASVAKQPSHPSYFMRLKISR